MYKLLTATNKYLCFFTYVEYIYCYLITNFLRKNNTELKNIIYDCKNNNYEIETIFKRTNKKV